MLSGIGRRARSKKWNRSDCADRHRRRGNLKGTISRFISRDMHPPITLVFQTQLFLAKHHGHSGFLRRGLGTLEPVRGQPASCARRRACPKPSPISSSHFLTGAIRYDGRPAAASDCTVFQAMFDQCGQPLDGACHASIGPMAKDASSVIGSTTHDMRKTWRETSSRGVQD